jgi:hypothetical protein
MDHLESLEPFLQGICACKKFPNFDRLWIDCIQEESQIDSMNGKKKGRNHETIVGKN